MKKSLLLLSMLGLASTGSAAVWINEIHYDNAGADVGEFVEVAANEDVDLTDWTIVPYNGSNGTTYSITSLSGNISQGNREVAVNITGLQNGAPDGVALVDSLGVVRDFISYEGSFNATNGPASGMASVDIGVSESNTTAGTSLQRSDDGTGAAVWAVPAAETPNARNNGQGQLPVELMNFSVE